MALGLPAAAELAWHWRDAWIYVGHGVPREPLFDVTSAVGRVAPVPLAAIYSTHDEFVPRTEADRLMAHAKAPARTWTIAAADHRFSGNPSGFERALTEAIDWVREHTG